MLETAHFRIEAISAQAPQASWYAGFVEQVHTDLSDLLGTALDRPIRVRLYPTEEAYVAANPIAMRAHGILAHARPSGDEIGLALVRLEALPGPARVGAFRHELAHMLLNQRSAGRLPIGFHEGIAQYVELDATTAADAQEGLVRAFRTNKLLSWQDLNQPRIFMAQPEIGYPQSYAVIAFLVEQHGFGGLLRMLDGLRDGLDLPAAILHGYGVTWDHLEQDWRASTPRHASSGLPRNTLEIGNLRPAQQAASEQRWADAAGLARAAEQFWRDVGHEGRVAEARAIASRADAVAMYQQSFVQARTYLENGAFDQAQATLERGIAQLPSEADPEYRTQLQAMLNQARAGVEGMASLESAREALLAYQVIDAQRHAERALERLTLAGDTAGAAEAREMLTRVQQHLTVGAIAALAVALLSGGLLYRGKSASRPTATVSGTKSQEIQL